MGPALVIAGVIALVAYLNPAPPPLPKPPAEHVVLLPDPDGKAGAVVVTSNAGELLLDQPYAGAAIHSDGNISAVQEQPAEIQQRYASALTAQPARPVSFSVLFVSGKDEPTAEAKLLLDEIKTEIAQRPAPEITVIGHTDSQGSEADNDALSLKRAEAVRKELIDAGIVPDSISIAGRGAREPVVPTAGGVSEPRNRRVEINVR